MQNTETVVIKIGTQVLTQDDGTLDLETISSIVSQLSQLKSRGINVLVVSSGSVGAGKGILPASLLKKNKVLNRQILSSVGQVKLMQTYSHLLEKEKLFCAQILATKEDFRDRSHYINMRNCLKGLLQENIIPIINENDVISVDELMFTDNDELAVLSAAMIEADRLFILTSVDGIFSKSPDEEGAILIPVIKEKSDLEQISLSPVKSKFGRGGMMTKLKFAKKAANLGIETHILNGKIPNIIINVLRGLPGGTLIKAQSKVSSLKKWLAFSDGDKPKVIINQGAQEALLSKQKVTSLLPVGIEKMEGNFSKGDLIEIVSEDGQTIGWGQAQYGKDKAMGLIGKSGGKALIHYDYLYID